MIPPKKPEDFTLLLTVFDYGLRHGIVSTQDVVAWADQIIMSEDEPDYFFIELSLCSDKGNMLEIIRDKVTVKLDIVGARAIFGLINCKLVDQTITYEQAMYLLYNTNLHTDIITRWECDEVYILDDYFDRSFEAEQLLENILAFLSIYQAFNLCNYDEWLDINRQIDEIINLLNDVLLKERATNRTGAYKKTIMPLTPSFKGYSILSGLGLTALYMLITSNPDFLGEWYCLPVVLLILFLGYWMVKGFAVLLD